MYLSYNISVLHTINLIHVVLQHVSKGLTKKKHRQLHKFGYRHYFHKTNSNCNTSSTLSSTVIFGKKMLHPFKADNNNNNLKNCATFACRVNLSFIKNSKSIL